MALRSVAWFVCVWFIVLLPHLATGEDRREKRARVDQDPAERFANYVTPIRREFVVDGITRTAFVFAPKSAVDTPAPIIFAFHGSGGTMQKAAQTFTLHKLWPEAIIVYPQGLPKLEDPDKTGWRIEQVSNPDLAFLDHLLATLGDESKIDPARIFATGHSNGGFFCYFLWEQRPDLFAALAPIACFAREQPDQLSPLSIFHVAGRNDPLVPLARQMDTIRWIQEVNQCGEGVRMRTPGCRLFRSEVGRPLLTMVHPGRHEIPEEAIPVMVRFFKRQSRDGENGADIPLEDP